MFLISGLWHGANWTFVIWGALHGAYVVFNRWLSKISALQGSPKGLPRIFKVLITFHLVLLAWIFFRANSLSDAWYIVTHLADFPEINSSYLASLILPFTRDYSAAAVFLTTLFFIALMETVHLIQETGYTRVYSMWDRSGIFRAVCLVVLLNIILLFGNFDSHSIIYFQF